MGAIYYNGQRYCGNNNDSPSMVIDDTLSDTSINPVQNKVIKAELDKKPDDFNVTVDGSSVVLDDLQGGVPFSKIIVKGKNLATVPQNITVFGTSTDGYKIAESETAVSYIIPIEHNTQYIFSNYKFGDTLRIFLFENYPSSITLSVNVKSIIFINSEIENYPTVTFNNDSYRYCVITVNKDASDFTPKIQFEIGNSATDYVEPIIGQELIVTVNNTDYTITPDSSLYSVPIEIYQQNGINTVYVTGEGEPTLSVTGVKTNAAVKKIWENMENAIYDIVNESNNGLAPRIDTTFDGVLNMDEPHYILSYINKAGGGDLNWYHLPETAFLDSSQAIDWVKRFDESPESAKELLGWVDSLKDYMGEDGDPRNIAEATDWVNSTARDWVDDLMAELGTPAKIPTFQSGRVSYTQGTSTSVTLGFVPTAIWVSNISSSKNVVNIARVDSTSTYFIIPADVQGLATGTLSYVAFK